MAIYIYHGDDSFQSRRGLTNALKDYSHIKHLEGKEISPENLTQASGGLFSQGNTALVLEKFFSLRKKQFQEAVKYIEKLDNSVDFFIWENKRLYPTKLNKVSLKTKVKEFKLPNTIFKLLDSIGKSNYQQLLRFLQGSFETHPPEVIFYLIQKRLQRMILAKVGSDNLTGAGWQKKKLYNQVKEVSVNLISNWYIKTTEIEWKNKTGRLGRELKEELVNLMLLFDNG